MGKKKETLNKAYFERYWRMYLTNIVINLFKWEGLPKEIYAIASSHNMLVPWKSLL